MIYVLVVKTLLDAAIGVSFLKQPPMALMFAGYTVCDFAAIWFKLRG